MIISKLAECSNLTIGDQPVKSFALSFLTLALLAAALPAATPIEFEERPWGQLGFAELDSAPYPHESRNEGFTTRSGTVYSSEEHYADSTVGFLVPAGYEQRDTVDLIVYFHGHGTVLRPMIPQFQLGEMLEESGVNAIMIAPQGPVDASDSENGKIDQPNGFTALVEESVQALLDAGVIDTTEIGRIAITGHSGGFHTLGQIIANGDMADKVLECWLLDASYAQLGYFAEFAVRDETRFISIFTNHLAEENVDIMSEIMLDRVSFLFTYDVLVTDDQLHDKGIIFLHTDLPHMQVPTYLTRILRASTLDKR